MNGIWHLVVQVIRRSMRVSQLSIHPLSSGVSSLRTCQVALIHSSLYFYVPFGVKIRLCLNSGILMKLGTSN